MHCVQEYCWRNWYFFHIYNTFPSWTSNTDAKITFGAALRPTSHHDATICLVNHRKNKYTNIKWTWEFRSIANSCFQQQLQSMKMSLRRNFEDTTGRQERRNLTASAEIRRGNEDSVIFLQSRGKHCLLEQTFVSSNMTFQNPEAACWSGFQEPGLQAAPVTRLQPIRTVCEQVSVLAFQGERKWVRATAHVCAWAQWQVAHNSKLEMTQMGTSWVNFNCALIWSDGFWMHYTYQPLWCSKFNFRAGL